MYVANDLRPGQVFQLPFVHVQDFVGHFQVVLLGRGTVLKSIPRSAP